jgi:hypothetical protein
VRGGRGGARDARARRFRRRARPARFLRSRLDSENDSLAPAPSGVSIAGTFLTTERESMAVEALADMRETAERRMVGSAGER